MESLQASTKENADTMILNANKLYAIFKRKKIATTEHFRSVENDTSKSGRQINKTNEIRNLSTITFTGAQWLKQLTSNKK